MDITGLPPKSVVLANGIILNYVRAGRGTPLIFIHGAMGDYRSWQPQWPGFIARFDCISYSRRYSYPNPNALEATNHNALVDAADLELFMDVLGLEKAILVGSSYGGYTALAMALRAPNRVRAVVAVEAPMMRYAMETAEGAAVAAEFLQNSAYPAREAFARGDDEAGVRILTGGIAGQAPEAVSPVVLHRRMANVRAARSLALSEDEFPWLEPDRLAALPMPVLLISGACTAPVHAAIFRNLCKVMPLARVRVIPQSGHSVTQEQPQVFMSEVLEFLSDTQLLSHVTA